MVQRMKTLELTMSKFEERMNRFEERLNDITASVIKIKERFKKN